MIENEYQEMIFDFIYVMAIRDAVMQKAYVGERKWMWDKSENMQDIKECLKKHLNLVLTGTYSKQEDFDTDFCEFAKQLCNLINEKGHGSDFKFGNAQKLINMMDKYFYITIFNDSAKREFFKYCHCPMDGQMIKKVLKKEFSWGSLEFDNDGKIPEQYVRFQDEVRNLAGKDWFPIEYDYKYW